MPSSARQMTTAEIDRAVTRDSEGSTLSFSSANIDFEHGHGLIQVTHVALH